MINKGMMSSNSNEWATPIKFFEELNKEFKFTLDPCATKDNAKCEKYFTKEDDVLTKNWSGERVFCNPPYGREIPYWVKKCYFHDYIYNKQEIRFIRGRLKFNDGKNPAPFPSMVVIFR